jgi:2,5-furandicarboxylate decarboxylase 1
LRDLGEVDVAVCIGNAPNVLAAAATSVELGIDELEIANALEPLQVVPAKTVDVLVPAEASSSWKARSTWTARHAEGPFVDLTETYDVVRQEPVFVVKAITHRADAIWHALLPGSAGAQAADGHAARANHFPQGQRGGALPGCAISTRAAVPGCMPSCRSTSSTRTTASESHPGCLCRTQFVQARLRGGRDIDIYNPLEVEWAMATRFQGDATW